MNAFNNKLDRDQVVGANGQAVIARAYKAVRAIQAGGDAKEAAQSVVGLALLLDTLAETLRVDTVTVLGAAARVRSQKRNKAAIRALTELVEGEFQW